MWILFLFLFVDLYRYYLADPPAPPPSQSRWIQLNVECAISFLALRHSNFRAWKVQFSCKNAQAVLGGIQKKKQLICKLYDFFGSNLVDLKILI